AVMTSPMPARTIRVLTSAAISSPNPHASEHLLDMLDWRLRHDPVAEIEDVRAACKGLERRIDRPVERRTAGDQRQRVNIALHRQSGLHLLARKRPIDHPVEPNCIYARLCNVFREHRAGSARKSDEFRPRHLPPDL